MEKGNPLCSTHCAEFGMYIFFRNIYSCKWIMFKAKITVNKTSTTDNSHSLNVPILPRCWWYVNSTYIYIILPYIQTQSIWINCWSTSFTLITSGIIHTKLNCKCIFIKSESNLYVGWFLLPFSISIQPPIHLIRVGNIHGRYIIQLLHLKYNQFIS